MSNEKRVKLMQLAKLEAKVVQKCVARGNGVQKVLKGDSS